MSSASTLPYARDALVTKLAARTGLSTVNVSRELPRREDDVKSDSGVWEAVWVGRQGGQDADFDSSEPFLTAGAPRWDETYTMWCTVQVLQPETAGTLATAHERVWELAYEVVGAISADLTLGVSISGEVLMFEVRSLEFVDRTAFLDKAGAGAQLEIGLSCFGRLRIT